MSERRSLTRTEDGRPIIPYGHEDWFWHKAEKRMYPYQRPILAFRGIREENGTCRLYYLHQKGMEEITIHYSQTAYVHSYDFEWGYGGSGPAQTALAILMEVTEDKQLSLRLYQHLKHQVIAHAPYHGWKIPMEELQKWIDANGAHPLTIE